MISMTGFGRGEFQVGERSFRVEARSFNNRFLDIRIRLPWVDGDLESRALAMVRRRVTRGRVEVSVLEERTSRAEAALRLDEALARSLAVVLRRLAGLLATDLATAAGLLPPLKELVGLDAGALPTEQAWPALQAGLRAALEGLGAMRRREGEALAADLAGHLQELRAVAGRLRGLAAGQPERARQRLEERLRQLGPAPVEPVRLAEEVALLADRSDVSEELARLDSHLEQLGAMLGVEGEVGRRFEFMLQELHRELNTIASKADSADMAHLVVTAKASVERMREQAQNVE